MPASRRIRPPRQGKRQDRGLHTHSISEALEIGDRIVGLKRPAMIAYDVSFDGGPGREERELIRGRIVEVLAA